MNLILQSWDTHNSYATFDTESNALSFHKRKNKDEVPITQISGYYSSLQEKQETIIFFAIEGKLFVQLNNKRILIEDTITCDYLDLRERVGFLVLKKGTERVLEVKDTELTPSPENYGATEDEEDVNFLLYISNVLQDKYRKQKLTEKWSSSGIVKN